MRAEPRWTSTNESGELCHPGVRPGWGGEMAGAHPGLASLLYRLLRHHVRGQIYFSAVSLISNINKRKRHSQDP